MFYEYAVEPSVLSSWQAVRYFLDAFGPWKGRFLAEYPNTWKKHVFERLNCRDVEKHRIIERLRSIDRRIFLRREGAKYSETRSWLENISTEHERKPFRAIIVTSNSNGVFLEADTVTDEHPLWRVEPGQNVSRTPEDFVRVLTPLLQASRHVAIIDPYFRADHNDKIQVVIHLCRTLSDRAVKIDIHACDACLSYHEFARIARRALPRMLPRTTSLALRSWKERIGGERFHNRFIVTDLGGVQFGDGIEEGERGQSDRLSLLGDDERSRLWNLFYGPDVAFDPAGPDVVISGTS